jgi:hypothetical protein
MHGLWVAEGRDKPKEEVVAAAVGYDAEVEKLRLQFEMRRWEEERQEREAERLRQEKIREEEKMERAAERERQERLAEAERERRNFDKIAEAERKIRQQELDLRRAEIAKQTKWRADKEEWQHQLEDAKKQREAEPVYKAKLFGDALRGTVAKMPSDALELIPWLRNVEKLFSDFKVSDELKVHLLKPHLTEQARNLIARMDPEKSSQYDDVKTMLLHEFKLSASSLLDRFNSLTRNVGETFTLYGNRLKGVLSYYVESRKADDYNSLMDLLICDRIKSQLSEGALRYVLSIESQSETGWLRLDKLVESLDIFYSTHSSYDKPRWSNSAISSSKSKTPPPRPPPPARSNSVKVASNSAGSKPSSGRVDKSVSRRCFVCNSDQHLANFHKSEQVGARSGVKNRAQVSRCEVGHESETVASTTVGSAGESVRPSAEVAVTSSKPASASTTVANCNEVMAEPPVVCE